MPAPPISLLDWRSLRTRITVGVLLSVVLALWVAALSISHYLRRDMEAAISAQQYSTVALVAGEIDRSLQERIKAVERMARGIVPAMLADPDTLRLYLKQHMEISPLFNLGTIVTDSQGLALASFPDSHRRAGVNYGRRDFVIQALAEGRSLVGDPIVDLQTGQPLIPMATPIKDAQGGAIGLVIGVTNLAQPNFLDEISATKYGSTGDFMLTAPRSRLFVASSDKRRVMTVGPPPGVNPVYDRYLEGYEGSGVARNSRGVVELSSSKRIPSTGWFMQAVLPADEAFAPIVGMQRRLLSISFVLTLFSGCVAWWWLRRQLKPLEEAAGLLGQMRDGSLPRQALPVLRNDEIGQLAKAFNGLLETIVAEEAKGAEHAANQRLRKIVSYVPGVVFQYRLHADGSGSVPFASEAIRDIYGLSPEEVESSTEPMRAILHPDDAQRFFDALHDSAKMLAPWRVEYRLRMPSGQIKWLLADAVPEKDTDGAILWHGFITDITAAKNMEGELRIAAATFESQEGIFITDADGVIIRVNRAFTEISGFTEAEAIGHTPALLKSGRHGAEFYRSLWDLLRRDGFWRGEIWNRRKNGELYAEWITITAVKDGEGHTTHYVSAFTDITEHKQVEEQMLRLAFYDPLTGLPNRRLFHDRLEQALATVARSKNAGALMFLDLDQFKHLNDRHGHIMGDRLLEEVARRLCLCVRGSDTVARLGGDEFVVMLQDLGMAADGSAEAEAAAVAEKIRIALAEPYLLQPAIDQAERSPVHYRCTVSIGISLFKGNGETRDEVVKQADIAMYAAKAAGRNAIRFFNAAVDANERSEIAPSA